MSIICTSVRLSYVSHTYGSVALLCFQFSYIDLTNQIYDVLVTEEERRSKSLTSSNNSIEIWAGLSPSAKKRRKELEILEEEANELLSYFNGCNIDALLKLTRNTLENIRKCIHTSSMVSLPGSHIAVLCLLIQPMERNMQM